MTKEDYIKALTEIIVRDNRENGNAAIEIDVTVLDWHYRLLYYAWDWDGSCYADRRTNRRGYPETEAVDIEDLPLTVLEKLYDAVK